MGFLSRVWDDPGPDKGWSWVIAIATCWITFCTYGVSRAAGVLFVALVETYGVGRQEASWPFTLAPAVACFFTVIAGVIYRYLSARQTVFMGGTLSAGGIGLCYFAYNLDWFVVCWGIVYGFGLALSVPLLITILNEFFDKQRATANGVYAAGNTLGVFFIPPLLSYLVKKYGLRGTMLVQSAFTLNIFIGAVLLRPRTLKQFPSLALQEGIQNNAIVGKDETKMETKIDDITGSYEVVVPKKWRRVSIPIDVAIPLEDENASGMRRNNTIRSRTSRCDGQSNELTESQQSLKVNSSSITNLDNIQNITKSESTPGKGYFRLLFEIISDPFFYLVVLSTASCFIPLFTFMVVIMDFGIDRGMSKEKAVLLMSAISVPELFGRLCFGWISDRGYVKYKTLFMVAKAIGSILLFFLPEVTNDSGIFAVAAIYGAVESCSIVLLNVLFVEYLGLEKLAISFSWAIFLDGFLFLAMPYVIGVFRDSIGSYDYLFYVLAALCLASSLSWLLEPMLMRRKSEKQSNNR